MKVVGNLKHKMWTAAHAEYAESAMQTLVLIENFLRFHLQDKHNASFQEISIGEPIKCKDIKKSIIFVKIKN